MTTDDSNTLEAGLPGCGLGLYALLLMFICGLGIAGTVSYTHLTLPTNSGV